MEVKTKAYGLIEVDERQKIHFPAGILGFESLKDYVLLDASQQPFYWLQSLDMVEIAFVLINPVVFRPDYTPDVSTAELQEINLGTLDSENSLVFVIVTIPEDQSRMTANLQGPIIINRKERIARQCISTNSMWKTQHYILEELAARKDSVC